MLVVGSTDFSCGRTATLLSADIQADVSAAEVDDEDDDEDDEELVLLFFFKLSPVNSISSFFTISSTNSRPLELLAVSGVTRSLLSPITPLPLTDDESNEMACLCFSCLIQNVESNEMACTCFSCFFSNVACALRSCRVEPTTKALERRTPTHS